MKPRIYGKGLEEHPKSKIFFGNFMMIIRIALGTSAG